MICPVLEGGISGAVVRSLGHDWLSVRRLRSRRRSLRLISFIGDKSVLLGYLSEDFEGFGLPSAGFLVLDALHSVYVVVPLDLLDHGAARLHPANVCRDCVRTFGIAVLHLNHKIKLQLGKNKI